MHHFARSILIVRWAVGLALLGCGHEGESLFDGGPSGEGSWTEVGLGGEPTGSGGAGASSSGDSGGAGASSSGDSGGAGASSSGDSGGAGASSSGDSGGGGPTNCQPQQPAAGCGPGMHCFPTPSGQTECVGPIGSGQQSQFCSDDVQCGAALSCISGGTQTCCMLWCTTSSDCPFGESCYPVDPAVYVGPQEWGVCYDPIWCGFL